MIEIEVFDKKYNTKLTLEHADAFERAFDISFTQFSYDTLNGRMPKIGEMWFLIKQACISAGGKSEELDILYKNTTIEDCGQITDAFLLLMIGQQPTADDVGNSEREPEQTEIEAAT